jgi:hypothetical protein
MMQTTIAQQVKQLLNNKSTTFAGIVYNTTVKPAAAHKQRTITKTVRANVQLFSNINAATSVFANAVKRTAANIADNAPANVDSFAAQSNYFEHTDCYSIVKHRLQDKFYLYAIFNGADSQYYIDGVAADKQAVAALLTPSAAADLMADNSIVHNKTYDVLHTVKVRTIALDNIVSITANKQTVAF